MATGLDGYTHDDSDAAHALLSAVLAEAFGETHAALAEARSDDDRERAYDGIHDLYDNKPTELSAVRELYAASQALQLEAVRALCSRIDWIAEQPTFDATAAWVGYESSPSWHHAGLFCQLLGRLVKKRRDYRLADLVAVIEIATNSPVTITPSSMAPNADSAADLPAIASTNP